MRLKSTPLNNKKSSKGIIKKPKETETNVIVSVKMIKQ